MSENSMQIEEKDEEAEKRVGQMKTEKKKKATAGIIYLSRIPSRMNVKIIREYFSHFGKLDRIYLEPRGSVIIILNKTINTVTKQMSVIATL